MAKREERKLLIGLDIGTSKVVAIVGELSSENTLEVIGIGSHPSRGLKRGVVAVSYTHLTLPTILRV